MNCSGKDIAVLGIGRSGRAAARLAKARGADVCVCDSGDPGKLESVSRELDQEGIDVVLGPGAETVDRHPDLVILSPGIDASWPIAAQFSGRGIEIIGELEFASRFWSGDVIGITGTNGKTTTTELIAGMLTEGGIPTEPAGNRGKPFSELVLEGGESSTATLEISSFQLETISTFTANIVVWLNFAPDHLDRYASVEDYRAAKLRIFENRPRDGWTVQRLGEDLPSDESRTITFSAFEEGGTYRFDGTHICRESERVLAMEGTKLRGLHNAENMMAAMAVADIKGVNVEAIRRTAETYRPPAHRNELVGTWEGREFINDSKATNLHALESSLRGSKQRVVLIAGGKEKGLPFVNLTDLIASKASHVVLIGELREKLAALWGGSVSCETAGSMADAVARAFAASEPGQAILFSPGTSSFDMFSGYEERGEAFRRAVANLNQEMLP